MMKDKETLQTFLDYRDHSVYIYYTDFYYSRKAHITDSIQQEKNELIQAKRQHIKDSVDKVIEERRRNKSIKQI